MSQAAPIPARFYPAGGDAHGHPALVELVGDVLQVLPEDSPPRQVPLPGLQAATRGFNHSQWAIAWPAESGGQHMLLIDEAAVGPLRAVAPALFAGGEGVRRRSSRRFLVGITLLALVPLLVVVALLASLDHLTDRVVARIPPSVERQIGAAVLARTRLEGRLIDQGPAFEAVQAIGRRLARPGETLEFHLTERPEINAFAAPGGVVVVNSGLLKRAASAEEVAGVLAHEIAHVELRHSLRQIVRSAGLRVIFGALAGDYDALGGWAAQLGELKFSRDAEREADRRGLERLAEARVDPAGMLRFFETLEKAEAGGKAGQLPALLSTHPATQERIIWLREATTTAGGGPVEPLAIDWRAVAGSLR